MEVVRDVVEAAVVVVAEVVALLLEVSAIGRQRAVPARAATRSASEACMSIYE